VKLLVSTNLLKELPRRRRLPRLLRRKFHTLQTKKNLTILSLRTTIVTVELLLLRPVITLLRVQLQLRPERSRKMTGPSEGNWKIKWRVRLTNNV
jgi:hypothetical protein